MLSHLLLDEAAVVDAVVGGLRAVVVVLGAYLVVSTVASLVVHGLRLGGAPAHAVDAITLPPVRRLVRAAVGVGVAAGTLAGAVPAGASSDPPVPVMRRLGDEAPPVMRTAQVEPGPEAEPEPEPGPAPEAGPATAQPVPAPAPPAPAAEWTVRPGDHFWRIAEDVLAAQLHRAPTDGETDPYWRRLVTANRDRLTDGDNPDLLFPGQVLLLPPTPTPTLAGT